MRVELERIREKAQRAMAGWPTWRRCTLCNAFRSTNSRPRTVPVTEKSPNERGENVELVFRKKPIEVRARVWTPGSPHPHVELHPETGSQCQHAGCHWNMGEHGVIRTLEGDMVVCPGDWVITGVKGEHYPCKPDIFNATYDPVLSPEKETDATRSATP